MKKVIVVGAGLAGLSVALKLLKKNIFVDLISILPAKRSHSVCAQGGINAAIDYYKEGDNPIIHAYETIKGGDFLADQPPVVKMCQAAPEIIYELASYGCLFNRTDEKMIDFRNFGGSLYRRTAYCSSTTGQQIVYSLDEQVRKFEEKKLVTRYEHHEFVKLLINKKNQAKGIIIQDDYDLKLKFLKSDAVVIATGGIGLIYKKSTNSYQCSGSANGILFTQGMKLANPEFIQIHPTAIPGLDKLRLISEATRSEGGRIWVYGDEDKKIIFPDGSLRSCGRKNQKWYFLEDMYPIYKNLVPRDIASREILKVCLLGLGIDKKDQVYLDVTHLDEKKIKKIEAPLEIYKKFTGEDPKKNPMKIFPAMHYSMGGAYVDFPSDKDSDRNIRFRHMTNIEGLFNIGESDFLYHGANRLGANSLLSCIFAGFISSEDIFNYISNISDEISDKEAIFFLKEEENFSRKILEKSGRENIFDLHDEMAKLMVDNVSVNRNHKNLKETIFKLKEIENRFENIALDDKSSKLNQTFLFARKFPFMIKLSLAIAKAALLREESRGSHYREDFQNRNDKNFLKTTICTYSDELDISYKDVDLRHFDPISRDYDKEQKIPEIKNL